MSEASPVVREPPPALRVVGLTKTFGRVTVLQNVSMTVSRGEIRALVGRNGSGKSTLIKILAGYHAPDPGGRLEIAGHDVPLPIAAGQAGQHGLSFVHQDLALIPELSVVDNLLVGRFARRPGGRIPWRHERARTIEALGRLGVDVDPNAPVSDLREVDRALLAIARSLLALDENAGVLVLDEPTAFLPAEDVERLFTAVRQARENGVAVIYVSHRLEEVLTLADTVTVLRDGEHVITRSVRNLAEAELIEHILGQRLEAFYPSVNQNPGQAVLSVERLRGSLVRDFSLSLRAGEIVGVTGLNGTGYDQVPYLIFGALPAASGTVTFGADTVSATRLKPPTAIAGGVALLPADRQRASGAQDMSVMYNVSLPVLRRFFRRGRLRHREERQATQRLITEHSVQPPNVDFMLSQLSGGNQQKSLLAKWLQLEPKVLLLHEPTQGVDVGSKQEIFARIEAAAKRGTAVMIASGEFGDLANLCHRVIVLRDGRVASTLAGAELSEERIADQAYRADARRSDRAAADRLELEGVSGGPTHVRNG